MADVNYKLNLDIGKTGDLNSLLPSDSKIKNLDRSVAQMRALREEVSRINSQKWDNALKSIGSALVDVGGKIGGLFTSAVEKVAELGIKTTAVGVGLGIAGATFGVKFNDELEQVKIGLASTFGAFGITKNMSEGLDAAGQLTGKMLQDVKTLPITFREFVSMLKNISAPAFLAGASANQLEEFTKKTAMFGAIAGLSAQQSASAMSMMLSGRVTNANPIARQLGIVGGKAKEFRDLDPAERFKELNKYLDRYKDANEAFSHSFKALFTTLKDNIILFAGRTTSPLFEAIKKDLVRINDWFNKNQSFVNSWADHFGTELAAAWHKGIAVAEKWFPIMLRFTAHLENQMKSIWIKVEPYVAKISKYIEDQLENSDKLFDKIGTAGKLYGATKLVGAVGSLGGPVGTGAAIAVGSLTLSFAAMEEAIKKDTTASQLWEDAQEHARKGWSKLTEAFKGDPFDTIVTKYGTFVAFMTDVWSRVFESVASAANMISSVWDWINDPTGIFADILKKEKEGYDEASRQSEELIKARRSFEPPGPVALGGSSEDRNNILNQAAKMITGGGGTHIQKVEIVVNQSGDPTRVARAVVDRLVDMQRYKRSSPFVRNYSSSTTYDGR